MVINDELIENLLYGEEGVDLDFKRDQYKFVKASDEEKGEMLKDIIAFANSWRRSDAFILIGVKEILGHENLKTTQIYTHVSVERLKKTYKTSHPKS